MHFIHITKILERITNLGFVLCDVRANASRAFPHGCMMAARAPAVVSAFKAGNDKTKNYASYFCPFIKKANFFPELLSRVLLMSVARKDSHGHPHSKGDWKKCQDCQNWLIMWDISLPLTKAELVNEGRVENRSGVGN